jgi:4-oxalocrotonate tautomerase
MPFVNVRTARGLLSPEQKIELRSRLADLMVEIEGRGHPEFRPFVMVLIEEHDAENWSVHGEPLTTRALEALAESLR